jgi:hypothetical protein
MVDEEYTLGALDASEILGVNRTRLSQLTSQGVLSFQRRKIGSHHRLFYRPSEISQYQNGTLKYTRQVLPQVSIDKALEEEIAFSKNVSLMQPPKKEVLFKRDAVDIHPKLKNAKDLKLERHQEWKGLFEKLDQITQNIESLERHVQFLQKSLNKVEVSMSLLKNSQKNQKIESLKKLKKPMKRIQHREEKPYITLEG